MTATPARMEIIRDRAHQRIGQGVHAQGDKNRQAAQRAGYAKDLIVIKEEKDVEHCLLRAFGDCADAIEQLGAEWDITRGRCRSPCGVS